jgi:acylphosphatase
MMDMETPSQERLSGIVEGEVQGVGYRMYVVNAARRVGVVGWVRNLSDGNVEFVAEGTKDALLELLRELEFGPHYGTVTKISVKFTPALGEFKQFWILETY